jgi:hypothetical protein
MQINSIPQCGMNFHKHEHSLHYLLFIAVKYSGKTPVIPHCEIISVLYIICSTVYLDSKLA